MEPRDLSMKKYFTIIILLIINLTQEIPQDYEFQHEIFQPEGISYDYPTCLMQDSRGFMWFGFRDGLKRYDGYGFQSYYHDDLDTASLSDNYILSMAEDMRGNLWIGTFEGGLNRYNRDKNDFTRYPVSGKDTFNLVKTAVMAVCPLRSGEIWFSAQSSLSQGVYCLIPKTGRIFPVIHDSVHTTEFNIGTATSNIVHFRTIFEDTRGNIWVGMWRGSKDLIP
jgi:ligand-binding sensor domain-containing protein